MAHDQYDIDEDLLYNCPCEFCENVFPFYLLIEHQYECEENPANFFNLTLDQVETEFINSGVAINQEGNTASGAESPNHSESPVPLEAVENVSETTHTQEEQNISPNLNESAPVALEAIENVSKTTQKESKKEFSSDEVLEDDIFLDDKTFTFGSTKNEKLEEEKPSFKAPPNPILNNDSKQLIQNNLTESDEEEGESLEDFWKRADIKLSQRLRMIEKKMHDRMI